MVFNFIYITVHTMESIKKWGALLKVLYMEELIANYPIIWGVSHIHGKIYGLRPNSEDRP